MKAYAVEGAKIINPTAGKTSVSATKATAEEVKAGTKAEGTTASVAMIVRPDNCPKCRQAEALIEGKDVKILPYEEGSEGEALAEKFGVFAAPALVINGKEVIKDFNKVLEYLKNIS